MRHKRLIEAISALLLAVIFLVVFCPVKFSIGETHIEKSLKKTDASSDVISQGYNHIQWDAPTGFYSSGNFYGFRFGNWVLGLDIWTGDG